MSVGGKLKSGDKGTWLATVTSLGALAAGVAVGIALRGTQGTFLSFLTGLGTLWISALRMVALPLAVFNTVRAMTQQRSSRAAGRVGGAIGIYIAYLLIGAALVLAILPPVLHRVTVDHGAIAKLSQGAVASSSKAANQKEGASTIGDLLTGLVPKNILQAAVNEDFLKLLVFAVLFGLALRRTKPETGGVVIRFVEGVTDTLLVLVRWIIAAAPVAMFALAVSFASNSGARIVGILGQFVVYECSLMLIFVALLYPLTSIAGGISLRRFSKAALGPQMVAISTRSSIAALPSLAAASEELLADNPGPARVVIPLSVSIFKVNRTISGLCRLLVMLYFWGVPADPGKIAIFLASIMIMSFSDLGIPGGGAPFRSVPAYLAAGAPIEAIILLEAFEPFSDLCKTLLNVTGDLSIAAIVTRWSARPEPREQAIAVAAGEAQYS